MKKSSASVLKSVGGDSGKLIVYSEPNYQGEEHTFKDTAGKINETPWKGKSVKSLIVQGNPWLFYPEELCKVSYGYTTCTSVFRRQSKTGAFMTLILQFAGRR